MDSPEAQLHGIFPQMVHLYAPEEDVCALLRHILHSLTVVSVVCAMMEKNGIFK